LYPLAGVGPAPADKVHPDQSSPSQPQGQWLRSALDGVQSHCKIGIRRRESVVVAGSVYQFEVECPSSRVKRGAAGEGIAADGAGAPVKGVVIGMDSGVERKAHRSRRS